MAANGREFSYTRFGEFKAGSQTLSRLRHFQAVCSMVPWRYAKTQAGSSLAWMIACIVGAVVAWLWGGQKLASPIKLSLCTDLAMKSPERRGSMWLSTDQQPGF